MSNDAYIPTDLDVTSP